MRSGSDFHGLTALEAVALAVLPALVETSAMANDGHPDTEMEVQIAFNIAEAFFAESDRRHTAMAVKDQESRRTHTKEELKARAEGNAP